MMLRLLLLCLAFHTAWAYDFDPLKKSRANKAMEEATEAFASKDYKTAIDRYKYLLDTLKINDDKVWLNLSHAYMRNADYTNAQTAYTKATQATNPTIRSLAYQQLGILAAEKKEKEEALKHFKNALRNDPNNLQALHNYELLLKAKEKEMPKSQDEKERQDQEKKNEQQKQDQKKDEKKDDKKNEDKSDNKKDKGDKDNKNGQKDLKQKENEKGEQGEKDSDEKSKEEKGKPKDSENKDKKEGKDQQDKQTKETPKEDGEKKGEAEKPAESGDKKKDMKHESVSVNKEQLQQMNMTEQQAKALLNAMKQQEVQYIQQLKKQPSKKNEGKSKKDW
jgi:Ca-activated chloride channel homolog